MGKIVKVKISHTLEIDTESWENEYGNKFDRSDADYIKLDSSDHINQHYKNLGILKEQG